MSQKNIRNLPLHVIFACKNCLTKHKKNVHEKNFDYICHLCGKGCFNPSSLKEHMGTNHGVGEKKHKCGTCGKKYWNGYNLKIHMESAHTNIEYPCEKCPKIFKVKAYLQTHIRIVHDKYRPHKCDICQEAYLYKRELIKHKANVHQVSSL